MRFHPVFRFALLASLVFSCRFSPSVGQENKHDDTLGLMPKQETGALRFLEEHPEFDGKGVVVAIFDTGVDPGAAGLQTTPDGRPKVIDVVDCTGSGDVDMSKVVKPKDGQVTGLSGRTLKLGKWKIPSGEVRIGVKVGYELYPHDMLPRIKTHRRKQFMEQQRKTENALRAEIENYSKEKSKVDKSELEKRLSALIAAGKGYKDPGPLYDCIVFHDGGMWRAVVDTDEDGDLAEEKVMTNYRAFRDHATFDDVTLLNFAVNIYEDGKVLSIVADAHPHGTHVAGIVAAHYPDRPEFNGVAPGAQIVSCKIGDTYIDGMETGQALIRATRTVVENKCDLINMSFGEPTRTPNKGLIIRYFTEVVEKHGVIFCASAGNAGPALSTVGAPGGTSTALIGIGAYVSPEMAAAQYALRERNEDTGYTWTSRGPTFDGDIGVNLFAPGGAIAPVPQWTLDRSVQMNGTSMASPNCCGNMALVLSGLKAEKIQYSPESVRRAFENTARRIEGVDVFAQGAGLIDTPAAFEALVRDQGKTGELLRFDVSQRNGKRGIYLREPMESGEGARPQEFTIQVGPHFTENATSKQKVDFRIRLHLESTAEWIQCGEQLTLTSGGDTMSVRVDPTELEPGVHFGEVYGFDADDHERGPLFRVPVTVCRLTASVSGYEVEEEPIFGVLVDGHLEEEIELGAAKTVRRFIEVPHGATWADIRFHVDPQHSGGKRRLFMIHTVQAVPGLTNRDTETNAFKILEGGVEDVHSIPVHGGRTMELAIAQYWSSLGETVLHYDLTFHGIETDQHTVALSPGDVARRVEVSSPLHHEHLDPKAKLTKVRRLIKPAKATIKAMAEDRDGFSGGRLFQRLELEYAITGPGSVTPTFPITDDLLYDSEYGGTVWAIYEAGGRRIATDDIWPDPVSLSKGDYRLKLWIRHTDRSRLDGLKSMALALEKPIGAVSLPIYSTIVAAKDRGATFRSRWIAPGEKQRLYVGNISKAPSGTLSGDVLLGSITYGAEDEHGGAGQRPGGFPLSVVVASTDAPASASKPAPAAEWNWPDEQPAKTPKQKLAKALRDAKLAQLKSLSIDSDREAFDKLAEQLLKNDENNFNILVTKLRKLDDVKKRKTRLQAVVDAADAILSRIDRAEIALALGTRIAGKEKDAAKKRKRAESLKALLIDTLYRKGRALGYMELPEVLEKNPIKDKKAHNKAFNETYDELNRWVDPTSQKYFLLHIRHETRKGNYGAALSTLSKYYSATDYWHIEKRRKLYHKLGWKHLESNELMWRTQRFPGGKPE